MTVGSRYSGVKTTSGGKQHDNGVGGMMSWQIYKSEMDGSLYTTNPHLLNHGSRYEEGEGSSL